jgi:hypothetical protein
MVGSPFHPFLLFCEPSSGSAIDTPSKGETLQAAKTSRGLIIRWIWVRTPEGCMALAVLAIIKARAQHILTAVCGLPAVLHECADGIRNERGRAALHKTYDKALPRHALHAGPEPFNNNKPPVLLL